MPHISPPAAPSHGAAVLSPTSKLKMANIERFPIRFRFQLSDLERDKLVTNCDRLQMLKHSNVNPFVFTEQGVAM